MGRRLGVSLVFFSLIGLWLMLAAADGGFQAPPPEAPAPVAGAVENPPAQGQDWALWLGDSVGFYCPEGSKGGAPCTDRVLDHVREDMARGACLPGLTLTAIVSNGQSFVQFEAEAFRCSRLKRPPKVALLEFNMSAFYRTTGFQRRGFKLPAVDAPLQPLAWGEDPFGAPAKTTVSPGLDRIWGSWISLCVWTRQDLQVLFQPNPLMLGPGSGSAEALPPKAAGTKIDWSYCVGRKEVFSWSVLDAGIRAGLRLRRVGTRVIYVAVPEDWDALRAQLTPLELAHVQGVVAKALQRLKDAGFEVVDLSHLLKGGFAAPPTQHLMTEGRRLFADALCGDLR